MRKSDRRTVPGLPETYFVPRDGAFQRMTAFDPHQLRMIRTELELLQRVRRRVDTCRARPATDLVNRYSPDDRQELSRILQDAAHQGVGDMIELFDREFPQIKEDIVMSVVNDEAEDIVQQAAEAGLINNATAGESGDTTPDAANRTAPAGSDTAPAETPPAEISNGLSQALDEVELALEETVRLCRESTDGLPEKLTAPEPVTTDTAITDESIQSGLQCSDTFEKGHEEAQTFASSPSSTHSAEAKPPSANSFDMANAARPAPAVDASVDTCSATAGTGASNGLPQAGPVDSVTPFTRTEAAVRTIEQGIRSMTAAMYDEVAEQWGDAQSLLEQVTTSGERVSASQQEIESLLVEVRKLRDDARSVADELDTTRKQARFAREEARRAKERAETSARAAELAADQASREAMDAVDPSTPAC